jgi:PDZ domain
MQRCPQRTRPLRGAPAWAGGARLPRALAWLALAACRSDGPRAEARQRSIDPPANGAPESVTLTGGAQPAEPKSANLPAPWLFTAEHSAGAGVLVSSMDIRSFAAPLLSPGDVILAVDGRPIHSVPGLERDLLSRPPGAMVVLTLRRNEKTLEYAMLQMPDSSVEAPGGADGQPQTGSGD